jgi:glycosyltransferase involved in cell wall biosynthesis
MKVAIVNAQAPFVRGGAELLADALRDKLAEHGHQAEVIRIPFAWQPADVILDHMLAVRQLKLGNCDRVIALKFPAYYVEHDSKVLWLLHQFRQAYDLHGSVYHLFPDTPEGRAIRDMIQRADDLHLSRARRIYTNSEVTSERLRKFNGLASKVLYPPLWDQEGYRCDGYGTYIFAAGRLSASKRQALLVEAMRYVQSKVRLVVAGPPEGPETLGELERLVAQHGLSDRVELIGRWLDEDEKRDLFAQALGSAYVPYDEDSYGYVTLESCLSRKAVVTCTDAGGVLALVRDGETGYVVPPSPKELAAAFDRLAGDGVARRLGENAFGLASELNISWDHVVDTLLA